MGRSLPTRDIEAPHPRRRYRYHRRHTPHFYLVSAGITGAVVVCGLNLAGYITGRTDLATIAFAAILVTALLIFTAFFWGFYLVSSGHMPNRRILILHGAVGMLAPLFYTLNIDAAMDRVGLPVSDLSLGISFACLAILLVQFLMGRAVVRPDPLRLVRGTPR